MAKKRRPPKPIHGHIIAVSDPCRNKDRWQVVVRTDEGHRHWRTFHQEDWALEFVSDLRKQVVAGKVNTSITDGFRASDGTVGWWSDLLAHIATSMISCADKGDREEFRRDMNAISRAGQSVRGLIDHGKMEEQVRKLEQQLRLIRSHRKHGTGTRGKTRKLGTTG